MTTVTKASYSALYDGLVETAKDCGLTCEHYGEIAYSDVTYPLLKIASQLQDRILVLTSGFHGDEIAGPLSLLEYLEDIASYAETKGIGLIIYPCTNPSGYDGGTRYNAKGEVNNNDFMRYLKDGMLVDDLQYGAEHEGWYWASDPSLGITLPEETAILHNEILNLPFERIVGLLDLHQDYFLSDPYTYTYVSGDRDIYEPIVDKVAALVPVLRGTTINSGQQDCPPEEIPVSDEHGFIRRHDCTITDLFFRLGIPYTVAVETTGAVPLETAMNVNLTWVKGIIDLVAAHQG